MSSTQSLRDLLSDEKWEEFQVKAAERLHTATTEESGQKPTQFESWLAKDWQVETKKSLVSGLSATGANWAITIAGAVIPLAFPPAAPLMAPILASLSAVSAMLVSEKLQQEIRKSIEDSQSNISLLNSNWIANGPAVSGLDATVEGVLLGEGGLARFVEKACSDSVIRSAKSVHGLSYELSDDRSYLNKDARLYFAELPWTNLVDAVYIACRSEIAKCFKAIEVRPGYDESVTGQAVLGTYWLSLMRTLFESQAISIVIDPVRAKGPVTIFDLKGSAVDWDLGRADAARHLIVWLPFGELDDKCVDALIAGVGVTKPQDAKEQILDFREMLEATWSGRADKSPHQYNQYPGKRA